MNETSGVLSYCQNTLSEAKGYHTEALGRVLDSRAAYEAAKYGNEVEGRSSIVTKDIMRTVNGALPSVVEPFLGEEIVKIDTERPQDVPGAEMQEALINYQWTKKHNPLELMESIAFNNMVDGTVWVMSGWSVDKHPTLKVCPFESVIPDPSATSMDDMRFVIHRTKVSTGDILSNPSWYGKHSKEDLATLVSNDNSEYEPEPTAGREDGYNPDDRSMELVEVFSYYGYYDLNKDDVAEPVLMIWSGNKLLRATESPYPFGPIPFDKSIYNKIPFSIYGATINDLIGDHQRLRTSMTRGIIDNMANSNNGQKFIRKGSLDAVNFNRLKRGDPYVELNMPTNTSADALIYDGNFNQLPPDVYKMLMDTENDMNNLTGITNAAIGGFDSRNINQTATGASIMSSMAQKRLLFIVRHISDMMSNAFRKWAVLNAELIQEATIPGANGEHINITGPELPSEQFGISIHTPTTGLKEKRVNDLTGMLQAVAPMSNILGPGPSMQIIMQMAKELDMPMLVAGIGKAYQESQQGNPQAEAAMDMEMREKEAEITKDIAQAGKYDAEAQAKTAEVILAAEGREKIG